MAIFNFFKKKTVKHIHLDELLDWLDEYVEAQKISENIAIIKREFKAKKVRLNELLDSLESAKVKDTSVIPERAISIFEGNRNSYIHKIRSFLSNLEIPEKYDDVKKFLEESAEKLENLATDTQKNFFIVRDFVADDVATVTKKLGEFDNLISSSIERLDKTSLNKVQEIKNLLRKFYDSERELENLRKSMESIQASKLTLFERKSKIEQKIISLRDSASFRDFEKLKILLEENKNSLIEKEKKIHSIISSVDSAIKKYAKLQANNILSEYLKEPFKTLKNDTTLKLYEELNNLQKSLPKLELKEDKEIKMKKIIDSLKKDSLEKLRNSILSLEDEISNLKKRISNNPSRLNVKEQEGWVESIQKDIEEEERKAEELENQIERINTKLIKQKISKLIKELDEFIELK
ncbi:hypothetical protein K9L97_02435 [Candidatus Woesearchaeota archaeon]|nr:hypothetical protein [Candidatus Woesearchaeota archaeon]